jgi:glycosyltransferase involved in cell wall biosynthesis
VKAEIVQRQSVRFAALRVAALIDTAIVSGPGRQLTALACGLAEYGVDLRVYMFQRKGVPISPFISYLSQAGVTHVVIPDDGPLDARLLARLGKRLGDWRPDIVQTHNYRTTVLAYLLRLRKPPWSWIAFFHGSTNENWKVRLYNRIDRALLPRADRLIVMSERHRREFQSAGASASVIHNAILDLPAGGNSASLDKFKRAGEPLIGVIGRLSPEKGVDILLDAMALLPPSSVQLVVAGDGPVRSALELQAKELGIAQDTHFLGTVSDVRSLYAQLDLVVLPSRSEGLPNVLLEALKANVPVVATSVGAVPEVVTDQAAGCVVPPGDPVLLADAIKAALIDGKSPAADAARAATAARFSLESRIEKHLRLYAELRPDRLASNAAP